MESNIAWTRVYRDARKGEYSRISNQLVPSADPTEKLTLGMCRSEHSSEVIVDLTSMTNEEDYNRSTGVIDFKNCPIVSDPYLTIRRRMQEFALGLRGLFEFF